MSSAEDPSSQGLSRVREQLHPSVPLKDRRRVARTLLEDPALHPALAQYVCEALRPKEGREDPSPEGSEGLGILLALAEDVILYEPEPRAVLAECLFETATRLRQDPKGFEGGLFASALRRYASLRAGEGLPRLVTFLDPRAPRVARQVVMQCVRNVLSVNPVLDRTDIEPLRARVEQLAFLYADHDVLLSPQIDSLCLDAYHAAILLGCREERALTVRFLGLGLLPSEQLVHVPLDRTLQTWKWLRTTLEPGPQAALFDAEIARLAEICDELSRGLRLTVSRQAL